MNLPTSIKIGYRDYAVEAWEPITASANRRLGEADHFGLKIRIRSDIPAVTQAEVLLHEVLHCAFWFGCIEDKDDEERTVSILSKRDGAGLAGQSRIRRLHKPVPNSLTRETET